MGKAEEELLVLAAQDGDPQAFRLLFQGHQKALLRYGFKVCADSQLAQDAVQEAWLKLAKNIRRLDDPGAFRSWMYQLVHWSCIDLLRVTRHVTNNQDITDELLATSDRVSDQIETLTVAINRLPATEKQMIHLFYLEELSVKEVAVVLKIAEGTVKSRLNRARRLLKERFDP